MNKQIVFTASLLLASGSAMAIDSDNTSDVSGDVSATTAPLILAQAEEPEVSESEKAKISEETESEAEKAAAKARANSALPEKSDPTESAALPEGESDKKMKDKKMKK